MYIYQAVKQQFVCVCGAVRAGSYVYLTILINTIQLFHCWYITLGEPPFVLFNVLQFAYREFHKRVICLKQAITHIDIIPHISLTIDYVLT